MNEAVNAQMDEDWPWPDVRCGANGAEKPLATYDNFAALMEHSNYPVQFNTISKRIVPPESVGASFSESVQLTMLRESVRDSLLRCGIKVDDRRIGNWLCIYADQHPVNPVRSYLEGIPVRYGHSESERLFNCLQFIGERRFSYRMFRKWLVQAIALAHNTGAAGADFVLVLQGAQGCGKTSFFRALCRPPALRGYFKEGASLAADNKDTVIEATRYWLVELGELERTTSREMGWLKAFLTNAADEFRPPYGAESVKYPRTTAFCATVNDASFLRESGRRFFVIEVSNVDLEALAEIDMDAVWAENYSTYLAMPDLFRLTGEEIGEIVQRSEQFRLKTDEDVTLRDALDFSAPAEQWDWRTSTEIAQMTGLRSSAKVGRTLNRMGYSRESSTLKIHFVRGRKLYLVPPTMQKRLLWGLHTVKNEGTAEKTAEPTP